MLVDDYGTICTHGEISGFGLRDCVLLAHRSEYEQPQSPHTMESWVLWSTLDGAGAPIVHFPLGIVGWLSGIWVTQDRTVYVTDLEGKLYAQPLASALGTAWVPAVTFPPGTHLHGVFGASDDDLWLWASDRASSFLLRGSGARWSRVDGPGFEIGIVRGRAKGPVYAGGSGGQLARWDGASWTTLALDADTPVTGIAVSEDDGCWITTDAGQLFEASDRGITLRARTEGLAPLADVAVWRGDVWLAGRDLGLMKLEPETGRLETVKPNILATRLDARGELLASCPNLVATSADAITWQGGLIDVIAKARGAMPPDWEGSRTP